MLVTGFATTGGVAVADSSSSFPPPDLFNLSALQVPATLPSTGDYYAGGIYSATSAQIASLQVLEQEAVTNTISDHALAATDIEAVESWARPDAKAELWALLVQAIQARAQVQPTPTSRTRPPGSPPSCSAKACWRPSPPASSTRSGPGSAPPVTRT